MTANPLYTEVQGETERLALKLIEREDVRQAREAARRELMKDPLSKTVDGILGLDRALDQWVLGLAMREANGDVTNPKVTWNISNPPRDWFGHVYCGAAVAIDNPDNFNREIPIDGAGTYEFSIRFSDDPPQFSILAEIEPEHHAGLGQNIGAFTLQQLREGAEPGQPVIVTVGPGEGGRFHLRTEPGQRVQVYTRDSQKHWAQVPASIEVRRTDRGPGTPRTEDEIAAKIVDDMPALVRFWAGFKDNFLGFPEPNTLVGPNARDGGWGYLMGGRFRLADDEALIITIDPVGSYYTGFQTSDPWTLSPDPMLRMVSLNSTQVAPDEDGLLTYVLAATDPGIANWIDTAGLKEGWTLLRWQGVPAGARPETFLRDISTVPMKDLAGAVRPEARRIDLAGRQAQLLERARLYAIRTTGPDWTAQA